MKLKLPEHFDCDILGSIRFRDRWVEVSVSSLRRHGLRGIALQPKRHHKGPACVIIGRHLKPMSRLCVETLLHEALHIRFPRMSEQSVAETANFLSRVLETTRRVTRTKRNPLAKTK